MRAKNNKGTITVFISIVLSAVFLVIGIFTDSARLKLAQSQIQRAGKTSLSSLLACYNNELKDEYGLFGLYLDNSTLEDSFDEYLRKNLNMNEQNFLYDYQIENIKIEQASTLLNRGEFEKQIMEFMKYRAPYEMASELTSKINGIKNISKGAQAYKRKLETDKQASEIGSLQLSLEEKTKAINSSQLSQSISEFKSKYISQSTQQANYMEKLYQLQNLMTQEKDDKKQQKLLNEIESLQHDITNITKEKDEIKSAIINGVTQYKSLNSQAADFAGTITNKKGVLSARIESEIQYTKDKLDGLNELQKSYKESLTNMQALLREDNSYGVIDALSNNVSKCESVLSAADSNEEDFLKSLDSIITPQNLAYTFNKAKPAYSDDKDTRDDVVYALKEAFKNPAGELKTIAAGESYLLPSHQMYQEENQAINWANINLDDESCAIDNLDYLSEKESKFDQIITKVTEELYVNEYILGTFKHDVPRLQGEDEKNSYNLRSKDKTKRDAFFSQFEVEYIINGNRDEAVNALLVKSEILAIRLVSNVIHIYTDTSKMARINALAATLSTWSAGLAAPLVQTMLVFSWAMAESLYDMDELAKGKKILLFKTQEQWKTDISGSILKNKAPSVENNPVALSYQDYLKIFLLLMDKDKKLARVQDLVQLNTGISNPGFLLADCKAALRADTTVSIKNVFVSLPSISEGTRRKITRSYVNKSVSIGY